MKVRLSTQVFSKSGADALDMAETINLLGFVGCNATAHFMRIINNSFDICNSRFPFARGCKSAITSSNFDEKETELRKCQKMLLSLRLADGKLVSSTRRSHCILGFVLSINSLIWLARKLLFDDINPLRFFLTYKTSQDHLELFFNSVR